MRTTWPESVQDRNEAASTSRMHSPDGTLLYLTSDRPDGLGGDDIYVTSRGADGRWWPLRDLPAPINERGNDRWPVLTPNGQIFVFDSDRSGGFGSKDIWWIKYADVLAVEARAHV